MTKTFGDSFNSFDSKKFKSDDNNFPVNEKDEKEKQDIHSKGSNSASEKKRASISEVVSINEKLKDIEKEMSAIIKKRMPYFNESESFEFYCSNHIDKILQEALLLENKMMKQRDVIRKKAEAFGRHFKNE